MSQNPAERQYNERETGELLKRATELQEQSSIPRDGGLTLKEIRQIASELGIDAEFLQHAANDLEHRKENESTSGFWRGPFKLDVHRAVSGSISARDRERLLAEFERHIGATGIRDDRPDFVEWISEYDFERTRLVIDGAEGEAGVRIQKHYAGRAGLSYVITFFLCATIASVLLDGGNNPMWVNLPIVGSSGLAGLLGVRAWLTSWTVSQRRRLEGWVDEMTSLLHSNRTALDSEAEPQTSSKPLVHEYISGDAAREAEQPTIQIEDDSPESDLSTKHQGSRSRT